MLHDAPAPAAVTAAAPPVDAPSATKKTVRLAWLDALRGLAALVVVYQHFGPRFLPTVHGQTWDWFEAGTYGVMLFFLVSGYIIPASLERRGSVRRFWISRFFRLYPVWILAVGALIVLRLVGEADVPAYVWDHPGAAAVTHAPMLQELLGIDNGLEVLWTLSYEMAFYLLVTGLFLVGMHRYSAEIALLFALVALTIGGDMPKMWLSDSFGVAPVAMVALAVFVLGIGAVVSGRRSVRVLGGVALGVLALALLLFNQRAGLWQGLLIPSAMFVGTALYRAEHKQISWFKALATAGVCLACALVGGVWNVTRWGWDADRVRQWQYMWVITIGAVALTFAIGMMLRHRTVPRVLTWLGVISYSVYMIHLVTLLALDHWGWPGEPLRRAAVGFAMLCLVLLLAWLSYTFVEVPMQRLGRRAMDWADARWGSDAPPRERPASPVRAESAGQAT